MKNDLSDVPEVITAREARRKMSLRIGPPYFRAMEGKGFNGRFFINNGTMNGVKVIDRLNRARHLLPIRLKLSVCGDVDTPPVLVTLSDFSGRDAKRIMVCISKVEE